jgi:hypothetical protein
MVRVCVRVMGLVVGVDDVGVGMRGSESCNRGGWVVDSVDGVVLVRLRSWNHSGVGWCWGAEDVGLLSDGRVCMVMEMCCYRRVTQMMNVCLSGHR